MPRTSAAHVAALAAIAVAWLVTLPRLVPSTLRRPRHLHLRRGASSCRRPALRRRLGQQGPILLRRPCARQDRLPARGHRDRGICGCLWPPRGPLARHVRRGADRRLALVTGFRAIPLVLTGPAYGAGMTHLPGVALCLAVAPWPCARAGSWQACSGAPAATEELILPIAAGALLTAAWHHRTWLGVVRAALAPSPSPSVGLGAMWLRGELPGWISNPGLNRAYADGDALGLAIRPSSAICSTPSPRMGGVVELSRSRPCPSSSSAFGGHGAEPASRLTGRSDPGRVPAGDASPSSGTSRLATLVAAILASARPPPGRTTPVPLSSPGARPRARGLETDRPRCPPGVMRAGRPALARRRSSCWPPSSPLARCIPTTTWRRRGRRRAGSTASDASPPRVSCSTPAPGPDLRPGRRQRRPGARRRAPPTRPRVPPVPPLLLRGPAGPRPDLGLPPRADALIVDRTCGPSRRAGVERLRRTGPRARRHRLHCVPTPTSQVCVGELG